MSLLGDYSELFAILIFLSAISYYFIFSRKKRKIESRIRKKLKKYHKKTGQKGIITDLFFIFERPRPEEMHDYLVKGLIFMEKKVAKQQNVKYEKHKFPDVLKEEDYFNKLEEETRNIHSQKNTHRKRYVVLYKTKRILEMSPWLGVEVELIKKKTKSTIVINKQLDVDMEMKWIAPLLEPKIKRRMEDYWAYCIMLLEDQELD